MEMQAASAEQETTPWYRQDIPTLSLSTLAATYPGQFSAHPDLRSSNLTTENAAPTAWDQLYGQPSRQAQTDFPSLGLAVPGTHELKGPAILTLQSASGHTQRVGLVGGTSQFHLNNGA